MMGTVGRFHMGTVLTEYANAIIATKAAPAASTTTARTRRSTGATSSLNAKNQYAPPKAKNATAATSFERGDLPMPVITYKALAGVPRCVAEAINPVMAKTRGTTRYRSMRRAADSSLEQNDATIVAMHPTAPAGAMVVNKTIPYHRHLPGCAAVRG